MSKIMELLGFEVETVASSLILWANDGLDGSRAVLRGF